MSYEQSDNQASSSTLHHRRPYRRYTSESVSSASSESDVERSLPPSPTDHYYAQSTTYRFAEEQERILAHARQAFDEPTQSGSEVRQAHPGNDDGDVEVKPVVDEEVEELREINPDDGDYAHIDGDPQVIQSEQDEDDSDESDDGNDVLREDRQCRICFGGPEDQETLGRLISPCLCAGSMRYVHVKCINAWRGTGTNKRAFMECPQCHHRYTLRRTLISGLATSKPIKLFLSTILFIILTLAAGQLLHFLLNRSPTAKKRILRKPTTLFDLFEEDWDEFDNGVIMVGGGGTLIWDVMVGSIQTFTSVSSRLIDSSPAFIKQLGLSEKMGSLIISIGFRFLLGMAVLGSLSFISLLLSLSLFAPLQLANGLRGAGLFNFRHGRGRTAAAGARDGTPAGQIMIIMFVLIGAVNTLVQVYKGVEKVTERGLLYVETQILEVKSEARRAAAEQGRQERMRRKREKWWRVWWREGRWATRQGWEEIRVRLWMWARSGLGPLWERMWTGRENHPIGADAGGRD